MRVSYLKKEYYQYLLKKDDSIPRNRMGVVYVHAGVTYFFLLFKTIINYTKPHEDKFEVVIHERKKTSTIKIIDFIIVDKELIEKPEISKDFIRDVSGYKKKEKKCICSKARRTINRSTERSKKVELYYEEYQRKTKLKRRRFAEKQVRKAVESMSVLENIPNSSEITQYIFDGTRIANYPEKIDILTVHNLKIAWEEMYYRLDDVLTLDFIIEANKHIARDQALKVGEMRDNDSITVSGVSGTYVIVRPKTYEVNAEIDKLNASISSKNFETTAIVFFIYLIVNQLFYDGNKRTAFIVLNKILISNGLGMLEFTQVNHKRFHYLLDRCFKYKNQKSEKEMVEYIKVECIKRIY